jgi:hypothetical protein
MTEWEPVFGLLLTFFAAMALLSAALMALFIWRFGIRAALGNPAGRWCAALVLFFGILALVCAASLLGQQEGGWRYVPLAAINLIVQLVWALRDWVYSPVATTVSRVTGAGQRGPWPSVGPVKQYLTVLRSKLDEMG